MEGVSALYGMAQTIPDKTIAKELCHRYLDILYKTDQFYKNILDSFTSFSNHIMIFVDIDNVDHIRG